MKFYRIFRTSECEGQVETDAQLTVNGGVVADLTGDVTGDIAGSIIGDVTGNVSGDVTGNIAGNITGNVAGSITGDVTGNVTGNLTGSIAGVAVTSGDGAPSGAAAVGDLYVDTTAGNIYINIAAEGTWKLITRADQ